MGDKLERQIKGFIEWALEHYHEEQQQLKDYARKEPTMAANYGGAKVNGGGSGRTKENIAISNIVTAQYLGRLAQDCAAIERTLAKCDSVDKKLIELVYWQKTHTVTGAGMEVGLSPAQAYQRRNAILSDIAYEMGYKTFTPKTRKK